jgi:hypothetical protein
MNHLFKTISNFVGRRGTVSSAKPCEEGHEDRYSGCAPERIVCSPAFRRLRKIGRMEKLKGLLGTFSLHPDILRSFHLRLKAGLQTLAPAYAMVAGERNFSRQPLAMEPGTGGPRNERRRESGNTERPHKESGEFDWFDRPSSRRLLWWLLWISCGATLVAEFFVHRHAYFGVDGWFGFYALLGLLGCSAMILFAKGFGYFVKRDENYYGDDTDDDVIPDDIDDGHVH